MARVPSQLNHFRLSAVLSVATIAQYLLLSLFLFSRVHPPLFQLTSHNILFPPPPPPPLSPSTQSDVELFACSVCNAMLAGDLRLFSCLSCNSTLSVAQPLCGVDVDCGGSRSAPPIEFQLWLAERAAIDAYYDNDTWLLSSAYCTAYDYRNCPLFVIDAILGFVMSIHPITIHPISLLSALSLIVVTVCEVSYVAYLLITERRRVKAKEAMAMLAVAAMRSPDTVLVGESHVLHDTAAAACDDDPSSLFRRRHPPSQ